MSRFGAQSMTGRLERVLVRPPLAEDAEHWRAYGWRAAPDHAAAAAEHEQLCGILEAAGAEVVVSRHDPGNPDAIYVYDPVLVGAEGAVLLRPGQGRTARRARARSRPRSTAADVPVASRLDEPVLAEGGDTVWLDERTLLVGIGYRTNPAAVPALARRLPRCRRDRLRPPALERARRGDASHVVPLAARPRSRARVSADSRRFGLLELLAERGIAVVEVPDEEFETQGPNVLALGPRHALALDGNPETRRRMERAGVDVVVYRGEEISKKGDGGPTCLTRPLLRG